MGEFFLARTVDSFFFYFLTTQAFICFYKFVLINVDRQQVFSIFTLGQWCR